MAMDGLPRLGRGGQDACSSDPRFARIDLVSTPMVGFRRAAVFASKLLWW
jgi:hypothetical protein